VVKHAVLASKDSPQIRIRTVLKKVNESAIGDFKDDRWLIRPYSLGLEASEVLRRMIRNSTIKVSIFS
jgi:hypothetical protein